MEKFTPTPEGDKFIQPVKLLLKDKVKALVVVIIILMATYIAWDVYMRIKDSLQTKYFNAGGNFIVQDLIKKSENCQKVKLVTGEEFVRTSCLVEANTQ